MKISKERFEQLISAYLDGEISPEHAQQLLDCINADARVRNFFLKSCAMHASLCKLYGKKAVFQNLASFDVNAALSAKKPSKFRTFAEWLVVGVSFAACASLMTAALIMRNSDKTDADGQTAVNAENYKTLLCDSPEVGNGDITIIKIYPKHSVLLMP